MINMGTTSQRKVEVIRASTDSHNSSMQGSSRAMISIRVVDPCSSRKVDTKTCSRRGARALEEDTVGSSNFSNRRRTTQRSMRKARHNSSSRYRHIILQRTPRHQVATMRHTHQLRMHRSQLLLVDRWATHMEAIRLATIPTRPSRQPAHNTPPHRSSSTTHPNHSRHTTRLNLRATSTTMPARLRHLINSNISRHLRQLQLLHRTSRFRMPVNTSRKRRKGQALCRYLPQGPTTSRQLYRV